MVVHSKPLAGINIGVASGRHSASRTVNRPERSSREFGLAADRVQGAACQLSCSPALLYRCVYTPTQNPGYITITSVSSESAPISRSSLGDPESLVLASM